MQCASPTPPNSFHTDMYADPSNLRDNPIKVRFNDTEKALIDTAANFNGRQPAVFVRDLVLAGLAALEQRSPDSDVA